jgi:hypothetical protein
VYLFYALSFQERARTANGGGIESVALILAFSQREKGPSFLD